MLRHLDFCGISVKYPRNRLFSTFWAGDDSRRLRDAAPDRSFFSRFLEILIYFIIDLSFLEIRKYNVTFLRRSAKVQFCENIHVHVFLQKS